MLEQPWDPASSRLLWVPAGRPDVAGGADGICVRSMDSWIQLVHGPKLACGEGAPVLILLELPPLWALPPWLSSAPAILPKHGWIFGRRHVS